VAPHGLLLHDQHVAVFGPAGDRRPSYTPQVFPNFDLAVDATYMAPWGVSAHGNWGAGKIADVPYVSVADWSVALAGLDAFLVALRGAPGMVIDVRGNGGGNDQFALAVAARFADASRAAGYVQYRSGPGHGDLTSPLAMTVSPGGPWQVTVPTLLLVGPKALSSTEDFVAAMRQSPRRAAPRSGTRTSPDGDRRRGSHGWGFRTPRRQSAWRGLELHRLPLALHDPRRHRRGGTRAPGARRGGRLRARAGPGAWLRRHVGREPRGRPDALPDRAGAHPAESRKDERPGEPKFTEPSRMAPQA